MIYAGPDLKPLNPGGSLFHAVGGGPCEEKTFISLAHDQQNLQVSFQCDNNSFINDNVYRSCNDPLYQQEVFEVFVARGGEVPRKYLEVEVNPNGALFVAGIDNPDGTGSLNQAQLIGCGESGIHWKVQANFQKGMWKGEIAIPLSLIAEQSEPENSMGESPGIESTGYRINFFRIVSRVHHPEPGWKNSPEDCHYLCYRSTDCSNRPNFHRPDKMSLMTLELP